MTDRMTITVGAGIVEVLQLDDSVMCRAFGVTWEPGPKGRIRVTATRDRLEELASSAAGRAGGGWDQPLWYAASGRSAAATIRKALAAAK